MADVTQLFIVEVAGDCFGYQGTGARTKLREGQFAAQYGEELLGDWVGMAHFRIVEKKSGTFFIDTRDPLLRINISCMKHVGCFPVKVQG